MRPAAATLFLVLTAVAAAGGDTHYLSGRSYEQDGARWSDRLSRFTPGKGTCAKPLRDRCTIDSLVIRNESSVDLRCQTRVAYPQPNDTGVADLESVEVIVAGSERDTVQVLDVPASLRPTEFSSRCVPLPPPPPLTTPGDCRARFVSAPNPGDFYPPISIKRNEQGPVIVEFTLADPRGPASKITVARSSEHPALDEAAVKFMSKVVMETACAGQRFRKTIPFQLGG